jgi:hydroxypyruvate reductase
MMRELLSHTRWHDLVLALISGGGSALMELLAEGVSLEELQTITNGLIRCGATIGEINVVRSALSQIKGGGLARMASPARVASLILSDVVGDPIHAIASGPTVEPEPPSSQPIEVLRKYGLGDGLSRVVRDRLSSVTEHVGNIRKSGPNVIVGSIRMAAKAAADRAQTLGFTPLILTTHLEGEASEVGTFMASLTKSVRRWGEPVQPPACLIAGGETTVRVRGGGRGGRNQEAAVAGALALAGWPHCLMGTLATDGIDGSTPAAGACVTGETARQAGAAGCDLQRALADNDTYSALSRLGLTLEIGPTGTNVNDLILLLVYP